MATGRGEITGAFCSTAPERNQRKIPRVVAASAADYNILGVAEMDYRAGAATDLLAGASVINSLGRRNSTSSSITVRSSTSAVPYVLRYATTSSTRTSGADAPAVMPMALTSFNQAGLMSAAESIKYESIPQCSPNSRRRLEFELFGEPMTRMTSTSLESSLTAF